MNQSDENWVTLLPEPDLPLGTGRELVVADRVIGLFRVAGGVYAIDGTCPHHGGPLGQGEVRQTCVVCPWHGLEVDLVTGSYHLGEPSSVRTYPVRVREGELQVRID